MIIMAIPKVSAVKALDGLKILVSFANRRQKVYDCSALLSDSAYSALKKPAVFRKVSVAPGGYGVAWTEELDLSEAELWEKGQAVP